MTDFDYQERYGERILSDYEEREEEQRIKDRDRLEDLEKAINEIKEILEDSEKITKEEMVGELRWITKSL